MAKQKNAKNLTKQFVGKPLPQVGTAMSSDATAVKPEIRQRKQIGNYKQIDSSKSDFIKDYGLPIAGGVLGGPLGAVYGGLASAILPPNIKQLGSKLLGDARMSDESLSDEQKVMLWDVIQAAKERTGKPDGGTEYSDYGTLGLGSSEQYNEWFNRGNIGLIEGAYNSLTNPGFQLGSTVGRGKYFTDPENPDKMYYTDVYDWNPGENYFSGNKIYQKVRNTLRAGEDQNLNAEKNDNYRMNFTFDAKEIEKLRNKKDGGWLDKFDEGGETNGWTVSPAVAAYNKAARQTPTNIDANAMRALEQVISYPQRKITELVTGTNQYPSQAMGIQNPYGAFAVDAIADPVNLVGAGLLGKAAKASTKTGILSKAHKLNPLAFKPTQGMMYRGLGEEGMKDAIESGVFRSKQNVEPFMSGRFDISKSFGTNPYFTPRFKTAESYGSKYLAEVPKEAANWRQRYGRTDWSQVADRAIPIDQGRILQKDWLQGYKPIKEDGGWLDKYNDGGPVQENYNDASVTYSPDFVGDGYSNVGRNYSPAWGGQFEDGGEMPTDKKSQEFYNMLKEYYTSPDRTQAEKTHYAAFQKLNEVHGYAPVRVANRTIMGKRSMMNPFTGRLNLVVDDDPEVGEIKSNPEKLIDKYITEYGHYQQYNENPEDSKLKKSGKFLGHMVKDFGNMLKNTKGLNFREAYNNNYLTPGTTEYEAHQVIQPELQNEFANYYGKEWAKNRVGFQMGGSIPGTVGFTYARTINPAPSKGPYGKKTVASAQNGTEMRFYQEGLDFKPKTISKNGSELKKLDQLTNFTNYNPTKPSGWLEKYQ